MIDLRITTDAVVWAKEFIRLYKKFGYEPDEQMMTTWFANAIMVGYYYGRNSREERPVL